MNWQKSHMVERYMILFYRFNFHNWRDNRSKVGILKTHLVLFISILKMSITVQEDG
jgi:hypothetical protein